MQSEGLLLSFASMLDVWDLPGLLLAQAGRVDPSMHEHRSRLSISLQFKAQLHLR
jgi:hypothetical protein